MGKARGEKYLFLPDPQTSKDQNRLDEGVHFSGHWITRRQQQPNSDDCGGGGEAAAAAAAARGVPY
jgi:hypothetical protein